MQQRALKLLRRALDNPDASFRDGQWQSIQGLLERKRTVRLL